MQKSKIHSRITTLKKKEEIYTKKTSIVLPLYFYSFTLNSFLKLSVLMSSLNWSNTPTGGHTINYSLAFVATFILHETCCLCFVLRLFMWHFWCMQRLCCTALWVVVWQSDVESQKKKNKNKKPAPVIDRKPRKEDNDFPYAWPSSDPSVVIPCWSVVLL